MKNTSNALFAKFTKLQRRERVLFMVALTIVLYLLAYVVLLGPQRAELKKLQLSSTNHQAELAGVSVSIDAAEKDALNRGERMAADQAEIANLKKQIADAEVYYAHTNGAISSSHMSAQLRQFLDTSPELALVSLKTYPVTPFQLTDSGANSAGANQGSRDAKTSTKNMYKYGAEISLKGNYLALLSYMKKLQAAPIHIFWSEAKLNAVYPISELRLVIYSLSDQPSSPLH